MAFIHRVQLVVAATGTLMILAMPASGGFCAAEAENGPRAGTIPTIAPTTDETPVRAVAVWSLNQDLQHCMEDATAVLARASLHASVGPIHTYFSPRSGYILRADFTRDGVSPPLTNRIICWQDGQMIVSRIAVPGLDSGTQPPPLAVPQARPHW
jgi:hypothetical protein